MSFYKIIRKIHLIATLILATFIVMYFFTGLIMIYEETFQRSNTSVRKFKEKIEGIRSIEPDSLVRWSKFKFDLSGQFRIRENEKRVLVDFNHPGTTASVRVLRDIDTVYVEIRKGNLNSVIHQYHRLHGYHGGLEYYAWAFVYDLSSLSMILFALTGLYLWYKTERNRLPGWIVFAASTALTFATILYMMFN
jgi:hypothetical protein